MADFLANSVVTSSNAAATNTLAAAVSSSSNNSGGGFALRFEPSGMAQSFSATVSQPHDASNPSASSVLAALRLAAAAAVTTASSTAAPMSPVKIDYTSGGGNGTLGLDYGNNTTACSSRASSFSSKLNNLYLSSLPESLIFPLISQQQQQRENISLPLTTANSSSSTQSATAAAAAAAAAAGLSRTATHSIFNLTPPDESRLSAFRARSATTTTTMFNHNNQHQQLYFGGNDINSANGNNNNNAVDAIMVDDMDSGFGGSALSTVSSLSNGNLAQSLPPNLNLFLNNFIAGNNGFGPLAELNTSSTASVTSLASNLSTNVGSSAQSASFPAFSPPPSSLTSQLAVKHTVASPQSSHNANDASESGSVSGASNATTVPPTAAGALSTYTFGASRSSSESSTTADNDSTAVTPTDAAVTTTAKQSLSTLFGGASSRKHMNSVASTKMDSSSPSPAGFSGSGGSKLSPLKMKAHIRNNSSKIECPSTTPPGSSAAVAQQHNQQQQQQHMDDDQSNICNVCGDEASGRHYGASTCFGCKGFFRRTVRANKTYNCRYEERCEIDKVGRNICRSCRFRKCLDVGMEPDAIRPDRDKTGRQKNPRRSSVMSASGSNYPSALPHTGGSVEMSSSALASLAGVELLPNIYGLNGEEKPASQTQQTRKQSSADTASGAEAMVAERDMVIETLLEIERICANLRDPQEFVEYKSHNNNNNEATTSGDDQCECSITASRRRSGCNDAAILADISRVFSQPLLLSARSPLDYSGQYGPLNFGMNGADEQRKPKAVRRECCCRRDFHDAFKRVATLAVDYANTLKPIADIDIHQRERLVRSFISSFVVFSSAYQSVAGTRGGITAARRDGSSSSSSSSSAILLPNGRYVDADTPFACFVDDRSLSESVAQSLQSKISFVCRQIVECVESRMERMRVTDVEYVCLKAIIVLDPSTAGLRAETADVLAVARDSVQNALFLHVMEKCTTSQSAIFRFGQLLMLIANVSKIGAFLSNTIEMCGTHLANTDRASGGGYKKTSTWWSAGSPAMALFVGAENHGGYSSVVRGVALEADAASAGWEMKMDEDESGADSADDDDADDDEDDEVAGGGAGNATMEPRRKYGGDGGGQPPPPQRDREEDCAMLLI